ncbi:MAG: histidine phosphatase family protein [Chloroflexi bacterium]|nr:histidine phosphatase family protein [Chloroflexota bacterium]
MARLLLVRHGTTAWNEMGRYQGSSDIALSARGLREAEALGKRLTDEKIDAFYASDLRRAVQTAQAIIPAERHGELVICRELREIDFGEFEGLTYNEIRTRHPICMTRCPSRSSDK